MQHLSSEITTVSRSKEHIAGSDLRRFAGPTESRILPEARDLFWRKCRRYQRGPYGSGRNCVNPDASFSQRFGERTGEGDDRPFACRIVEQLRTATICGYRRSVDDRASLAKMVERRFGHVEARKHI